MDNVVRPCLEAEGITDLRLPIQAISSVLSLVDVNAHTVNHKLLLVAYLVSAGYWPNPLPIHVS